MKIDLLLTKNVLLKLVESVLIPLGLIAASVADAGIHKKVLIWSALWTITLVPGTHIDQKSQSRYKTNI